MAAMNQSLPKGLERFQFRSQLGQGGMGVVYRVYDADLGRDVALKTLPSANAEAIYRLKREFRSLAELSHPNLINLYELFSQDDSWYFTMELVEGTNFLSYIEGRTGAPTNEATQASTHQLPVEATTKSIHATQPLPDVVLPAISGLSDSSVSGEEKTSHRADDAFAKSAVATSGFTVERLVDALIQLTRGVQALHDAGKEHRDLKPANVMVTSQGRVVLLDFGLAVDRQSKEFYEDVTEVTSSSGTPSYMAPERHRGQIATVASDWYSVGVMLYEALTGNKPFLRVSEVLEGLPPKDPRELAPEVPAELATLALDLLKHEPNQRPRGPEILTRLGRSNERPTKSIAPAAVVNGLVGRKAHLEKLHAAFDALATEHTIQVQVQGASGYGKTALLTHFLQELIASDRAVVLAGRCYERESVPYKVFDSVIDSLARYLQTLARDEVKALLPDDVKVLTRLFPPLLRVHAVAESPELDVDVKDVQELARRASAALKTVFNRVAARKPLVLYVDDLQWGDVDSSRLLAELLSAPPPSLMLVVSFRSEDLKANNSVLHSLLHATTTSGIRTVSIEVGPLSASESSELARRAVGEGAPLSAERLSQEAAGSPFFVQQLAQYAASAPEAMRRETQLTLAALLRANVAQLPSSSQQLLTVMSVAGRPIARQLVARAAQVEDAAEAFIGLRSGNWVRVSGPKQTDTVETYHDKIRETLVGDLVPTRLKAIHRTLAEIFEGESPQDPEALTTHWLGADEPKKAGAYAMLAAQKASATLAFDRTAELYRLALRELPGDAPGVRPALFGLADSLKNAGRGPEAAEVYLQAAEKAKDADERLELERLAFEQYLISGYLEKGRDLAQRVLLSVGLSLPQGRWSIIASLLFRRARVTLRGRKFKERTASEIPRSQLSRIDVCWSMAVGLSLVDNKLGSDYTARYLLFALDGGEPDRISRALSLEAAHQGGGGSFKKAETLLHEAEALAEKTKSPHAIALASQNRGWVEYFQGRYQVALGCFDRSSLLLREKCTGVAWEMSTAHMMATWSLVYLGQWDELARRYGPLMAEARQTGDLYRIDSLSVCAGVISGLMVDDVPRVRQEMKEAAERWNPSGFQLQHFFRLLMGGFTDLYAGEPEKYWPKLMEQWEPLKASLLLTVVEINYRMHLIRAFAAVSQPDSKEMRAQAMKSVKVLEGIPSTGSKGLGGVVRAAISNRDGKTELALQQLQVALTDYDAAGMALYASAARWRVGQLTGGDTGAQLVSHARTFFHSKGIQQPDRMLRLLAPGFAD